MPQYKSIYLQHLSQKNLSSAFNVSVELKFFKQLVIELFCSISRLKSKNVSSLAVTVSHCKHLVSLVSIPWSQQLATMKFHNIDINLNFVINKLYPLQSSQFILPPNLLQQQKKMTKKNWQSRSPESFCVPK
jgi:hypothetical protein